MLDKYQWKKKLQLHEKPAAIAQHVPHIWDIRLHGYIRNASK